MIIFRNYQWGAEKRNTTLWYDDNFVGTELNVGVEYAKVADACGLKGIKAETMEGLTAALKTAVKEQLGDNVTTFIEVVLNQELGEPFRRDAMKAPVAVAGISADDMKPQQGS
jgi:sulfoacetaldehyde acetyltransferase